MYDFRVASVPQTSKPPWFWGTFRRLGGTSAIAGGVQNLKGGLEAIGGGVQNWAQVLHQRASLACISQRVKSTNIDL